MSLERQQLTVAHSAELNAQVFAANPGGTSTAHLRQSFELWNAGRFEDCIADLDEIGIAHHHTSESIFLRARALLRVHRIKEAETWLRMMESHHTGNADAIATHAMLLGNAHARLNQIESASALFDQARAMAPHATIVAEIAYYHALALWTARDFTAAREHLQPALTAGQDIVSARALQLLGFIALAEGRFDQAHLHFEAALDAVDRCRESDLHLKATIIHQLSIGNAEIAPRDPSWLDDLAHSLPWTPDLVLERIQTLRHIGLAYARTGKPREAIARFIEITRLLPGSSWAVIGFAEAANLCLSLRESIGARGYVDMARHLADTYVEWNNVTGEPRTALLTLAMVVARYGDGTQARCYMDLYRQFDRTEIALPVLSVLNLSLRLEMLEQHAEGVILAALYDRRSSGILTDVASAWNGLHYPVRAAEARTDLQLLTSNGNDSHGPLTASAYPGNGVLPITTDLSRARKERGRVIFVRGSYGRSKNITITLRQDSIVRRIVQGATIANVAHELAISTKTVRNHLAKLYALFGVGGLPQLIAVILGDTHLRDCFVA